MAGARYITIHKDLHDKLKHIIGSAHGGGFTFSDIKRAIEVEMQEHSTTDRVSFAIGPYKADEHGFIRGGTAVKREGDGLYTTLSTHSLEFPPQDYIEIEIPGSDATSKIADDLMYLNVNIGDRSGSQTIETNAVEVLIDVASNAFGGQGKSNEEARAIVDAGTSAEFNRLLTESSLDVEKLELIDGRVIATVQAQEGTIRGQVSKPVDVLNALADSILISDGKRVTKIDAIDAASELTGEDASIFEDEIERFTKGGTIDEFHDRLIKRLGGKDGNTAKAVAKIVRMKAALEANGDNQVVESLKLGDALKRTGEVEIFSSAPGSRAVITGVESKLLPIESTRPLENAVREELGDIKVRLPSLNKLLPRLGPSTDFSQYAKMGTIREISQVTGLSVQDIYQTLSKFKSGDMIDARHVDIETLTSPGALEALGMRQGDKFVLSAAIARGKNGTIEIDPSTGQTMFRKMTDFEANKLKGYYIGEGGQLDKIIDFLDQGYDISDPNAARYAADVSDMLQWFGAYGDVEFYGETMEDVLEEARHAYSSPRTTIQQKEAAMKLMNDIEQTRGSYLGDIHSKAGAIELRNGSTGQLLYEIGGGGQEGLERFFEANAQQRMEMIHKWLSDVPEIERQARISELRRVMRRNVQNATMLMTNLGSAGSTEDEIVRAVQKHLTGGDMVVSHKFDISYMANALKRLGVGTSELQGIMDEILKRPRADVSALYRLLQAENIYAGNRVSLQALLKEIPGMGDLLASIIPAGGGPAQSIEFHHPLRDILLSGKALVEGTSNIDAIDTILSQINDVTDEFSFDELMKPNRYFTMSATGATFGDTPAALMAEHGIDLSTFREMNPGKLTHSQEQYYPVEARSVWQIESFTPTEPGGANVVVRDVITGDRTVLPFGKMRGALNFISQTDTFEADVRTAKQFASGNVVMKAIDEAERWKREALGLQRRGGSMIKDVSEFIKSARAHELSYNIEFIRLEDYVRAISVSDPDAREAAVRSVIGTMSEQDWLVEQTAKAQTEIDNFYPQAIREYRPSVRKVLSDRLKKNMIAPQLEQFFTQTGPTPPDAIRKLIANKGKAISIQIPGTLRPNAVIDLGDFGDMFSEHIRTAFTDLSEETREKIVSHVVGNREMIDVAPHKGGSPAEAAINMIFKRVQQAEADFTNSKDALQLASKDMIASMLDIDNMDFTPGTINIVTRDLEATLQTVTGQIVGELAENAKDAVGRRVSSGQFTGAPRALYGLFDNNIEDFVDAMKNEPMMQYIVHTMQTGENMPTTEMADSLKDRNRTLFTYALEQMDNETLYDTARRLRPYSELDYMQSAAQQVDDIMAKRMNIPVVPHIPPPHIPASYTAPLTEMAQHVRGRLPMMGIIAGGLAVVGAMVNKSFVDKLPERGRLKDDTSHVTPDGTAMPGPNRPYGELQQPELTDEAVGDGGGVTMRVSGLKSPMQAEQIIRAMGQRSGAVRNIRRRRRKIDDSYIHDILGDMI